jgi:hypothetical protein
MLLYIGPGDDGRPGAVREKEREVEVGGCRRDFLEENYFSGSHRNLLTGDSRSIQCQKLTSLTQVFSESFRKFPFRSGTATGDITPHCPPPLEGGGRSAAKDVLRDGYLWVSNHERPVLMVSIM